jgi:hypothetical protein
LSPPGDSLSHSVSCAVPDIETPEDLGRRQLPSVPEVVGGGLD